MNTDGANWPKNVTIHGHTHLGNCPIQMWEGQWCEGCSKPRPHTAELNQLGKFWLCRHCLPGTTDAQATLLGQHCVYFAQHSHTKRIKIGKTYNIEARRTRAISPVSHDWRNPYSLEVLLTVPGYTATEVYYHEMFDKERFRGEWFTPSAALMGFIESEAEPS